MGREFHCVFATVLKEFFFEENIRKQKLRMFNENGCAYTRRINSSYL